MNKLIQEFLHKLPNTCEYEIVKGEIFILTGWRKEYSRCDDNKRVSTLKRDKSIHISHSIPHSEVKEMLARCKQLLINDELNNAITNFK